MARRRIRGAAIVVLVAAGLIAIVAYFGAGDGQPGRSRAALSLAAPFLVAGVVALIGERLRRPHYVTAAGMALIPISLISIIAIPILIPAALLIVAGTRATRPGWTLEMLPGLLIVIGIVGAMVTLIFHDDPARWTTPKGQHHSTSDLVTGTESVMSASILLAVIVIARFVPGPSTWRQMSAAGEDRLGDTLHPGVDREQ